MGTTKALAAALLAVGCVLAHAGEREFCDALKVDMQSAFARGDYQAIDKRYAAALASSERTPAGLFVAQVIREGLLPDMDYRPPPEVAWAAREAQVGDWVARFPDSSLAAITLSNIYLTHGWIYRGGGYANTVTPEAMQKLQLYAQKSFDTLMGREKAGRGKDPYWYAQMLNVAQSQGWSSKDFIGLVQEATQAFPRNYDIYFAATSNLQPRWGGSAKAIASLADYAVQQTRAADGESIYALIYWRFRDGIDTEIGGPDADWKRIRAGFEDLIKRYPERSNINRYAVMACRAHDVPTTRSVLLRMKSDIDADVWPDRQTYLRCVEAAGLKREQLQ
jgi:hypothetical protein